MAVAGIKVSEALIVGSKFACRTGSLCCGAGGGGAWTHIAGSIERLVRIVFTATLSTRRAEARLAPGHSITLTDVGDGTSPALFDIGQRRE